MKHTAALIFLLENLGLVMNYPKSPITRTQLIEFLGFIIYSLSMELKLPGEKIIKIRGETRGLHTQASPNALALSCLLMKLNRATQVIPPAPLFYRNLQACLKETLDRGGQNGWSLILTPPSLTIETDSSCHYCTYLNNCFYSQYKYL